MGLLPNTASVANRHNDFPYREHHMDSGAYRTILMHLGYLQLLGVRTAIAEWNFPLRANLTSWTPRSRPASA